MAEEKLYKLTALPAAASLVADAVYFIKGASDTKAKVFITTTTTPIAAIPQDGLSEADITLLLLTKQDKFTGATTEYVRGDGSLATLNKAAVGLGNTDDTSDANKPISTAQAAVNLLKANDADVIKLTQKGAVNGVATLDAGGKVPAAQLPSYVDDVLEFANLAAFPATGETGKMYVAIDTNQIYRWSGSAYIKISSGDVTEMANFFVRYDAAQSLNATKQTQARTNIGALGTADLSTYATITGSDAKYTRYDAAQSLTAAQQTQARANIGAASTANLSSYLPLAGGALTGALTGTTATFSGVMSASSLDSTAVPSGTAIQGLFLKNGSTQRWQMGKMDLESGGNSGSNFKLARFDDSGTLLGIALSIDRATGVSTFTSAVAGVAPTAASHFVTRNYLETWSNGQFAAKATTLSGYGITDAYTKVETNTLLNAKNQWMATEW